MELKTNYTDKDKIRALEDEISQLKKQLEVSKVVSQSQNNKSGSKNFTNLFGVVDGDYNVLSINEHWNNSLSESQEAFYGKKCYSAFCGLNEPCETCELLANSSNKSALYFIGPQSDGEISTCQQSLITPVQETQSIELNLIDSQLFESTGDSLLIIDDKGQILKFTKRICDVLSYTIDEFSDLTVFDIDDPTNSLIFEERIAKVKREKGAVFETDFISKSGKLIPVECSLSPIKYQNKTLFFTAIRDIETRKSAEKELLESEIRFRSLVENATDLVMRFDREHRHVFVNSASQHVLGIPPQNFIGKTHHEMGFPDDLCELWEEAMDKVFESGISDSVDFSIHAKGNEMYFEWQLIPEFDTEDEIPYLLAVARDVSKRTISEKTLEETIKTRDKFFSIIAHDLRNPFGSLRTLSEYILSNEDLTRDEIKEFAEIINMSASQGFNLLENLLEWSRSQRGTIKWQPVEFDLVDSIQSNINLIQANLHKKKINLSFEAKKSYCVYADKYMIETIIRNLLGNAVKFTYMNGNIHIDISVQEGHYCISIKDDGKGISKENQTRLFQLDNQYSSVGTDMETGTGLGLILCKEFIDTNNGRIYLESEEGVGSCFSFTVPKK